MAGDLHHTAQPPTLAAFRPWGSSAGAGRIRLAAANIGKEVQGSTFNVQGSEFRVQGLPYPDRYRERSRRGVFSVKIVKKGR